ncbi:MAG: ABC transporter [Beggiatoa sp. IS2]|nr:MAG: ABC transporter [Beggiatoa sp. IS2]
MPKHHVVVAEALTKVYQQQIVVNAITFSVPRGEFLGILGPNGAGKTTTLRMLVGNTSPSGGRLHVLNWPIPAQARAMRAYIGIVPQKDNLDPDFSVTQNLMVYGNYFGLSRSVLKQRIPKLLEIAALENKADAIVTTLSGGMQRRLSLARALINEPELLILDEPTTGLDPQARQLIWQRLRQLRKAGLTLILTTHYMEEAERLCDHIIIVNNGCILEQGSPYDLIAKYIEPQVVEVYGNTLDAWHEQVGRHLSFRSEHIGDTWFYYGFEVEPLLQKLRAWTPLRYLHRPANLEDVFLRLTGRDLRDT